MSLNDLLTQPTRPGATPLIVVAAALIDDGGRVLMQQRSAGKAHGSFWEFPGGKVEAGEAPAQALARELQEELDIDVAAGDLTPFGFATENDDARSIILLLFRCSRWRGVPRALDASALRWDQPAALVRLPMPPLDVPLLAALIARAR